MGKTGPKTLGIIPARGGSKSIPHKNIALLAGKPLIFYSIQSAKKAKRLDAYIVSTDDKEIADVAKSYGADVPFLRPHKFAQDHSTDIEFLKHALLWLRDNRGWKPDIVLNLRPTSPLRKAEDIDAVIALMQETGCDSVRTIIKPNNNPYKMWYFKEKGSEMKPFIPTEHFDAMGTDVPRQLLPQNIYWQNAMVDATRAKFILDENKVYGPDIRGIVSDEKRSVDIDDPADLAYVEWLIKNSS